MVAVVATDVDRQWEAPARSSGGELPGDILECAAAAPGEHRTITADLALASAAISETLAPVRLEAQHGPPGFQLDLRRFRAFGIELSLVSIGAELALSAPPLRDHYLVAVPISGHVTAGTRGQVCKLSRTTGIVISPNQPVFFSEPTSDCRQLCVRIAKAKVNSALSVMLRRPVPQAPEFAFRLDVCAPRSRPLMRALELAALEMLEDDATAARSVMASSISQLVINSLLLSQEHTYADELRNPLVDPDFPEPLRVAQRFMVDHAADSIGVADIARAANLSVRALEEGFARYVHVPPTVYLRDLRLVSAHEDLLRSKPEETTVRAVAERWGFRHAGRFSTIYRERFGVSPSQELRNREVGGQHSG